MNEIAAGIPLDEETRVRDWQLGQLLRLGYPTDVALSLLIAHADYHELDRLILAGCPLELAAKIVG